MPSGVEILRSAQVDKRKAMLVCLGTFIVAALVGMLAERGTLHPTC